MKDRSKIRLIIAVVLFFGWVGWLVYVAAAKRYTIVLSRPQFFVSNAWIVANLKGMSSPETIVTVEEVIWTSGEHKKLTKGAEIKVFDLDKVGNEQNWVGPGLYILPLSSSGNGYRLTRTPPSPGYPPPSPGKQPPSLEDQLKRRLFIYPDLQQTRQQLQEIKNQQEG